MANNLIKTFDQMESNSYGYGRTELLHKMRRWLELAFNDGPYTKNLTDLLKHVREKYPMRCPETGAFTAWKKAYRNELDESVRELIVELEIPEDAQRVNSGFNDKCRCDKALVKSITNLAGNFEFYEAKSDYSNLFVYGLGRMVSVENFNKNPFVSCGAGIHFYMTRGEAEEYMLYNHQICRDRDENNCLCE